MTGHLKPASKAQTTPQGQGVPRIENGAQTAAPASTVCAVYKDRWQIETFFKALKQNLKIKTFVGTSENALNIQIWTALIAMLLIKFLQFKARFRWSLSNLVAFLRWNLFAYLNLWDWIDSPFETIPLQPAPVQNPLPFSGFGQH